MQAFSDFVITLNGWAWGPVMLVLLLGTGLYLSIGLRFLTLRNIPRAFRLLFGGREGQGQGDISPFSALMTSLSATIGTGNIAGVATALALGGPGALFWMWITALVGMATKYAEAVCAVRFREQDAAGNYSGGPMYYIRNGLHKRWHWLAWAFAVFGTLAGFGIANTVQSNSVAQVLEDFMAVPPLATGLVLMGLVAAVILGGVKRIARVASWLVPMMALGYVIMGALVLVTHITAIPAALLTIVDAAFSGAAAAGGFAGATVWAAIRFGVARGIFSNEAGLGSAPIAHAAAQTSQPVQQGMIAMLGTFIDTLIVCTMTGLVIVIMDVLPTGVSGASLTSMAFAQGMPGGQYVVTIGLCLFAFTTMIGWSFYGERCAVFLFGIRASLPFRLLWVLAIPVGTLIDLELVWLIADTLNAFMAIPNLIALLLLAPLVFRISRAYFDGQPAPEA
ncbi:MAG: sodium:alanine symporter family protein [Haliea sp.]|uniref:alanine/glycine:cation symporter family protein n=1 Tax=Haliea sp. TaxID=1932666 RepID=UPI000C3BADBE|nr:sodium:alanine symporter family protein [Haliea sp.]MBM71089.1 sodium:alanine symporter family protein [Haliea sp.]|tara:strand:+ start:38790 stop:40139 length:1350 start_codon:yes stop_codon:yes gene_type:complete